MTRTVIFLAVGTLVVGALAGYMSAWGTSPQVDLHSYSGGVERAVVHHDEPDGAPVSADYLVAACQTYVDAGMNKLDGYPSGVDFMAGCRDEAARLAR